jgi:hypothetical protein
MTRALVRLVLLTGAWIGTPTMTPAVSAQAQGPTVIGSISGAAELVKVHGSYAYVAAGPELRIVSLVDPAAPRVVGSFQFVQKIWALAVSGSTVYAANDWVGLAILDVTDPAAPRLRGTYKTGTRCSRRRQEAS